MSLSATVSILRRAGRGAALLRELRRGGGPEARVGLFASAVPSAPGESLNVAEIAAVQTFGTRDGRIPPRPFLEPGMAEGEEQISRALQAGVRRYLAGTFTREEALALGAEAAAAAVRRYVRAGVDPPNAPSTIAAKGSSLPLVDTGRMIGAIAYQISTAGDA